MWGPPGGAHATSRARPACRARTVSQPCCHARRARLDNSLKQHARTSFDAAATAQIALVPIYAALNNALVAAGDGPAEIALLRACLAASEGCVDAAARAKAPRWLAELLQAVVGRRGTV